MFELYRAVQLEIFLYSPIFQKNRSVAGVQNELIIMCDNHGGVLIPRYRIDKRADIFHTTVVQSAGRFVKNRQSFILQK